LLSWNFLCINKNYWTFYEAVNFEMENPMEENTTIEILKQAILLERRGKAFY
jgi:hypothetical protein